MEPGQQDKIRMASSTLDSINELIKKGEFQGIISVINGCPYPRQLAHCYDKQGQGIFFKLTRVSDENESLRQLKRFQAEGGQLHRRDNNKQTVIYYAARFERVKLVQYLVSEDLALNDNDYVMQTPLYYAAKYNRVTTIIDLLVKNGCDPNHKDANGQTCLFYAAAEGHLETCRLLADSGANILSTDKNKERAMHYARRGNHREIVEFLTSFGRKEVRKVQELRQERRVQESSQNTVDRRRKKQITRNQCCLVYTNQEGESKVLSYEELMAFRDSSENNAKLFALMSNPEDPVEGLAPAPDRRFEKLALKILSHFTRHENGHLFSQPVNYKAHGLFDYPTVVKFPMDFGTIRKKLGLNAYENEVDFQGDMNLIFDNCILYHGTEKDLGKISLQMKTEFNAMFFKEFI